MQYGICCVPVSSIRREPMHTSEIISQVLFGEYLILKGDQADKWVRVMCCYDRYEGWMHAYHLDLAPHENNSFPEHVLTNENAGVVLYEGRPMLLPLGCNFQLPAWFIDQHDLKYEGERWDTEYVKITDDLVRSFAFRFINTTYLWGGKSVYGIDCSGYVQLVYKFLGVPLLRDAFMQAGQGIDVGFLQEVICGDLAFFDNEAGRIIHVGIMLNDHEIIHASGKVRLDDIDTSGIVNRDTGERTHRLRLLKRVR